jgi:endonuclease YncB( thermonuclease family)
MIRWLLLLSLCFHACAWATQWHGKVVRVSDGDTITVTDSKRAKRIVRIATIDAPESRQAYGKAARQKLAALVMGQQVMVQSHQRDQYGREVGQVWLRPAQCGACDFSRDAGLVQIEAGYAWWYRDFSREQIPADQAHYAQAEADAKARRAGLWQDSQPIPPWEWRKTHKPSTAASPHRPIVRSAHAVKIRAKKQGRVRTSHARLNQSQTM